MVQREQSASACGSRGDDGAPADGRRTVQDGMLKSVRIRNYRVFDDLRIDRLSRINLIAGRNNAGKTSLLEALFLLSGGGNPEQAVNANVIRGWDLPVTGLRNVLRETYWKPLFAKLDTNKFVEISGTHIMRGPLKLHISMERQDVVDLPLDSPKNLSEQVSRNDLSILFSFRDGNESEIEGRVRVTEEGIQAQRSSASAPLNAIILSTRPDNNHQDAARLGQLRQKKQGAEIVDTLRIIEPRLQSIEENSVGGFPMIWGDIGLPELVPLAMMGEGMTRLARLVLAIASVPGGLVLVDEVETGLHHSVLQDVWRAIDEASRQFDTQIVATTHSYECIRAAHEALGSGDGFLLHRLETSDKGNRCVTYSPDSIDAAMRHNFEVR